MTRSKKLFLIDMDNVLCNYSKGLTDFANRILRTKVDWSKGIFESQRLNLGISDDLYESVKLTYRLSGEKLYLEQMDGAKEFIDQIKEKYKILIWTARPTHQYPVLKEYTKGWLDRNEIFYDDIIWQEGFGKMRELEKWKREIEDKGENMQDYELYMIDDDKQFCNQVANWKIMSGIYLIDWIYNQGYTDPLITRIKTLKQLTP